MATEKRITLKIDPEKHREVKIKAVTDGIELSDLVRTLLDLWLSGKVKLPKVNK